MAPRKVLSEYRSSPVRTACAVLCARACVRVCTCVRVRVSVCVRACVCVRVCVRACSCVYARVYPGVYKLQLEVCAVVVDPRESGHEFKLVQLRHPVHVVAPVPLHFLQLHLHR